MSLYQFLSYLQLVIFIAFGIVFSALLEKYFKKHKESEVQKQNERK